MTTYTHNTNGHGVNVSGKPQTKLTREDIHEMANVVHRELNELHAGRVENVLLIEALANQWSAEHIVSVARQRGKNWRFLAALADKALQAQGVSLLIAITEATGMDLTENLMWKSYQTLDRLDSLYKTHIKARGENPYKAQIYDEARQAIVDSFMQGKTLYYQLAGRLILQLLGE